MVIFMLSNFIQIILDVLLLFICSIHMFKEFSDIKAKDFLIFPLLIIVCTIIRSSILFSDTGRVSFSLEQYGYEILPVNNVVLLLLIFLVMLIINSLWFRGKNGYIFWGTAGVFVIFIMIREICAILFYICGVTGDLWMLYFNRFLSLGLAILFLYTPPFRLLKENIKDGSILVRLSIANTAIILILLLNFVEFDLSSILSKLPITLGTLGGLIVLNLCVLMWEQRQIQERKRINMLEQYIPVIEELITQVNARQHEYNNRLVAISSAVFTAEHLEQAKEKVNQLIQVEQMNDIYRQILNCDSKMISGMLYSKMKQAEAQKITVRTDLNTPFKKSKVQEVDWIEIIGILMDNAIEASNAMDTILIRADAKDEHVSLLVSNPSEAFTKKQFVLMFRRGFTTKKHPSYVNGQGLANIDRIAERYHGKIIARNETIEDKNHVTIGVLL